MLSRERVTLQDEFIKHLVYNGERATLEEMENRMHLPRKNIHNLAQHLIRRALIKKFIRKVYENGSYRFEIIFEINFMKKDKVRLILEKIRRLTNINIRLSKPFEIWSRQYAKC